MIIIHDHDNNVCFAEVKKKDKQEKNNDTSIIDEQPRPVEYFTSAKGMVRQDKTYGGPTCCGMRSKELVVRQESFQINHRCCCWCCKTVDRTVVLYQAVDIVSTTYGPRNCCKCIPGYQLCCFYMVVPCDLCCPKAEIDVKPRGIPLLQGSNDIYKSGQ
jgi:hypothetical protein